MTVGDELTALAQDYVSGRVDLRTLDMWLAQHVDECDELDTTAHPAAGLSGFILVRIYEMDDGLKEDELKAELRQYLEQLQPRPEPERRATG
ncbi:MAG: hypothetical protein ACYDEB_11675 [Dehalococcoidia bacterium]